jgi:uncharacterized Tic20 family protein
VINQSITILVWLINLFDPPPLASMSQAQKIGRIFLVTITLVISCILTAMLVTVGIFVIERARDLLGSVPKLLDDLGIIFVSMVVNAICVIVLLEIKKTDGKLIPPPSAQPGTDRL